MQSDSLGIDTSLITRRNSSNDSFILSCSHSLPRSAANAANYPQIENHHIIYCFHISHSTLCSAKISSPFCNSYRFSRSSRSGSPSLPQCQLFFVLKSKFSGDTRRSAWHCRHFKIFPQTPPSRLLLHRHRHQFHCTSAEIMVD